MKPGYCPNHSTGVKLPDRLRGDAASVRGMTFHDEQSPGRHAFVRHQQVATPVAANRLGV